MDPNKPVEQAVAAGVELALKNMEQKVDQELEVLQNTTLDELRAKRLEELKEAKRVREENLKLGHGKLTELMDEAEFFRAARKSHRMICLVYKEGDILSKILIEKLTELAEMHLETRFTRIVSHRCKFLNRRFQVISFPVIHTIEGNVRCGTICNFKPLGPASQLTAQKVEEALTAFDIVDERPGVPKLLYHTDESDDGDDSD